MPVEVWQFARPKGRPPRWAFRVIAAGSIVFESAWVSVRYVARQDAEWLAGLIDGLADRGIYPGSPGHRGQVACQLSWVGELDDDCGAVAGDLVCHAEHLSGPFRGGMWYCSVSRSGVFHFHTGDSGVRPRSGVAARWLCEIVVRAEIAGLLECSLTG
jgi:hypothetical protein